MFHSDSRLIFVRASGEAILGTQRYFIKAFYQNTLSNHFIQALYPSTLSKHFIKALYQITLSKHVIQALYQITLSNHFIQALYQSTLSEHFIKVLQSRLSRYYNRVYQSIFPLLGEYNIARISKHPSNIFVQLTHRGEVLRSITCSQGKHNTSL